MFLFDENRAVRLSVQQEGMDDDDMVSLSKVSTWLNPSIKPSASGVLIDGGCFT